MDLLFSSMSLSRLSYSGYFGTSSVWVSGLMGFVVLGATVIRWVEDSIYKFQYKIIFLNFFEILYIFESKIKLQFKHV